MFFFSSRRRHTRYWRDWSSDVCSSDLDAQGIADYYRQTFGAPTTLLSYGAPLIAPGDDRLAELGLAPGEFHLVVARFEPENHVDVIVEGHRRSAAPKPLVVVGSAAYRPEERRAGKGGRSRWSPYH